MATPQPKKTASGHPDLGSIGGVVVGLGGILGGLILDGGKVTELKQVTAFLIVIGGTVGAVMLTTPLEVLIGAIKKLGSIFFEKAQPVAQTIDEIVGLP